MGRKAFADIDEILAKIRGISGEQFHKVSIGQIAEVLYRRALVGAESAKNPMGRAWKPLSTNTAGQGLPLRVAPSTLKQAVNDLVMGMTFTFAHAKAHQKGASRQLVKVSTGAALSLKVLKRLKKGQVKKLVDRGVLSRAPWRLPARNMLPPGGRLPPVWAADVNEVMREVWGSWWK